MCFVIDIEISIAYEAEKIQSSLIAVHGFKGSGVQGWILVSGLHFVLMHSTER